MFFQRSHSSRTRKSSSGIPAFSHSGAHAQRRRSWSISFFETRPEKMTVSMGNFSIRKWVLKKWIEKIKPAASRLRRNEQ